MRDDDHFLSRWSRRKAQARTQAEQSGESADKPVPSPVTAESTAQPVVVSSGPACAAAGPHRPADAESAQRPLPSLDSLRGLESEYGEFLKPEVGEDTRRAALKRLFADPHFNQMDGLDVYIDDYGKFEPMPAAVATSLAAFHRLSVFDHLASEQAEAADRGDASEERSAREVRRAHGEQRVPGAAPAGDGAGSGEPYSDIADADSGRGDTPAGDGTTRPER